jgi:hypothetical protein
MTRLIRHDPNVPLIDRIAAEVHFELHFLLQHHYQLAGVVVRAEKFVRIVQSINVLPAAACEWLKKGGPTDVIEDRFPIHRVAKITK